MAGSILTDTKKIIGISESDTSFDLDILTHINSTFSVLQQLGVGPDAGFYIEDSSDEWADYIDDDNGYNLIRTYILLKVRILFDPPQNAYLLTAMEKQIAEYEWRISHWREWSLNPVDPMVTAEEDTDE